MKKFFKNLTQTAKVVTKNRTSVCENLDVHVNITTAWALGLGNASSFSNEEMEILDIASKFHDLGKCKIWDVITSSAKADQKMRDEINTHSIIGAVMAFFKAIALGKGIRFALRVFKIVLCHHDYITGVGANGFKVADKLTQTLTIADIIAARCYDDPTRNYPVDLANPIALAEDLTHSANFNKEVLAKVPAVYAQVSEKLGNEYAIEVIA